MSSDATNAIVGVFVAGIAMTEIVTRQRGLAGIWSTALVVTTMIAIAAWLVGRSDSPLCEPDSPLQPHAVWHVLSALLVLGSVFSDLDWNEVGEAIRSLDAVRCSG